MHEYNLSFVPMDDACEYYHFEAQDDDDAKTVARRYLGNRPVQIWQVARILERFEEAPPASEAGQNSFSSPHCVT